MKASTMISGALVPTMPAPFSVVTTKPSVAASEYAGAVDAIPTTMLPTRPMAPSLRPLLTLSSDSVVVTAHPSRKRCGPPGPRRTP